MITRAVGIDVIRTTPDLYTCALKPGDRLLLCTDGLYKMLPDQEIAHLVSEGANPRIIAQSLIEAVLKTKADDNIALLVVEVGWE